MSDFLDELIDASEAQEPGFKAQYERYKLVRTLAEHRATIGKSQAEIAQLMGTVAPRVVEIEKGNNVTSERLFAYMSALGAVVSVEFSDALNAPKRGRGRPVSAGTTAGNKPKAR